MTEGGQSLLDLSGLRPLEGPCPSVQAKIWSPLPMPRPCPVVALETSSQAQQELVCSCL